MFRFFKGKWVGEDELKLKEREIMDTRLRLYTAYDKYKEKEHELLNIIEEKEKATQELKQEVKMLKKGIEWWKKKSRIETERSEILAEQYWALKESLELKGE